MLRLCHYVLCPITNRGSGCCLGGCNKLNIFLFNLSAITFQNLTAFQPTRLIFNFSDCCERFLRLYVRSEKDRALQRMKCHYIKPHDSCTNYCCISCQTMSSGSHRRHDHLHTIDEKWYFMFFSFTHSLSLSFFPQCNNSMAQHF